MDTFFWAVVITWVSVGTFLIFRTWSKQLEYLGRFPPVDGIPLGWHVPPHVKRVGKRVMHERQPDEELEQLRREVWRRYRYYLLWVFGFPFTVVAVMVPLILTGVVH